MTNEEKSAPKEHNDAGMRKRYTKQENFPVDYDSGLHVQTLSLILRIRFV